MARIFRHVFFAIAILLANASQVFAAYPERPIKIIVGFPPGGITDVLARTIGIKLGERLGQSVVIENRAGAGGAIGAAAVAKAAPDGYTIALGTTGTHAVLYALGKATQYHPLRDFSPIILLGTSPNVLVVPESSRFKSFADVIAAARAKPGQLMHASSGIGATPQLSLQLLNRMANIDITEVMYNGNEAFNDTVAGHVDMAFYSVVTSVPLIRDGRLRALAVSSAERVPQLPNVPTVAESGFPGYDVVAWYGLWAPAKTPPEIVNKLNQEVNAILKMPDVSRKLSELGADLKGGSVEDFKAYNQKEFDRWTALFQEKKQAD